MRRFLPFAALALLAAPLTAAAPRPWTAVVTPIATGGYVSGNPRARVKLVEYVSYTCPHCAHYVAESGATVKAMVRSGSTSVEVRSQVHDGLDLIAAALARCVGPRAFAAYHERVFADQSQWMDRASAWGDANRDRIASWPQLAQMKAMSDGAGLTAIARAAGAPAAAIDACFASDAAVKRVVAASQATAGVRGTPAFAINGGPVEYLRWPELQPKLRAAGAK